jgi:hypothetical protein
MVGDIGEVIAAFFYQVALQGEGRHNWDGTYNGRNVQIKATGSKTYLKQPAGSFMKRPSAVEWPACRTYPSMQTRLMRGHFGSALNAGGNHCLCILGRSSSPSIYAQMNVVRAVIVA